jgi:hypothetical protein
MSLEVVDNGMVLFLIEPDDSIAKFPAFLEIEAKLFDDSSLAE